MSLPNQFRFARIIPPLKQTAVGSLSHNETVEGLEDQSCWEGGQEHPLCVQGIWVAGEDDMYHCTACSKWYHESCMTPVDYFDRAWICTLWS